MNRKERFLTAVNIQEPDRVPMFDFLFQQPLYEALIGRKPSAYNGPDAVQLALALNHDGVWLPFGGFTGLQPTYLADNVYVDEWGTTFKNTGASWPIDAPIDYPIKTREDLRKYKLPDPTLPGRASEIDAARQMDNGDIALLGGVNGPLTTAWFLMGYETIAYSIYDDPELFMSVLKLSNEYFMEAARRSVEAGCVAMWMSEDLGDSTRPFFRPALYRKYLWPFEAELAEFIAGLGVPVLLHCDGQIWDLMPDLVQLKISAIHPLQRTASMDLRRFKELYGKRLCIIGNINSSATLPYGTPEDVAAEVREAIEIAAPGGGYILASDHSLHDGISVENCLTMMRTCLEYGSAIYQKEPAGE